MEGQDKPYRVWVDATYDGSNDPSIKTMLPIPYTTKQGEENGKEKSGKEK